MDNTVVNRTHSEYSDHAYTVLKIGFVLAPLLAGLDKFFNYLTTWTKYLAPVFPDMLNIPASSFMMVVGVIEIIAGIGVLMKPKIFAYVVSAWLLGIIVNLFILGGYYDVALRDLGLSMGAFALGQLAMEHEHEVVKGHRGSILHRKRDTLSYQ